MAVLSCRQKTPQNDCFVLKTKNNPKRLLILEKIFQKKKKQYSFEELDPIKVKGKKNKVMVYRIENGK